MFWEKKKKREGKKGKLKAHQSPGGCRTAGSREGVWVYVVMMKLLLGKLQFV